MLRGKWLHTPTDGQKWGKMRKFEFFWRKLPGTEIWHPKATPIQKDGKKYPPGPTFDLGLFRLLPLLLTKQFIGIKLSQYNYHHVIVNMLIFRLGLILVLYTHTHTHTHIYIYIYIYTHTHIYIYTYKYIYTYIYIYIYIYI